MIQLTGFLSRCMRAVDQCTIRRCFKTNKAVAFSVGLHIKWLQMYPSFQDTIAQKHIYCVWYVSLTSLVVCLLACLLALNQRRGVMFSLPFIFHSFLWDLPWEKRKTLMEILQQTWTTVFQKCPPLTWTLFWPFFPLSIPFLGIWDPTSWIWPLISDKH